MKKTILLAGLAGLLAAAPALAGDEPLVITTKGDGSGYVYTTGDGDGDDVRVIVKGDNGGVVVLSDNDKAGARTLRMQSNDGRMVFETEPDADKPWLGILLTTTDEGVEINSVMEGSPAERAGLRAGDLITSVDGRDLTDPESRGGLLDDKKPGDRVRFTVIREGKEERLRARLDSHPGRVEFELDEDMGAFGMAGNVLGNLGSLRSLESLKKLEGLKGLSYLPLFDCDDDDAPCNPTILSFLTRSKPRLGVVLESLSPQLAEFFEVSEGHGMLVKEVLEDSVAERAGLKAGDVLLEIDDTKITNLGDVREALREIEKGDAIRVEVMRRGSRESFRAEIDSDPSPASGFDFSFGPGTTLESQGQQGALRRDALEAYQRAVEASSRKRGDSAAAVASEAYARELAERRALEESAAAAKKSRGAAERTF